MRSVGYAHACLATGRTLDASSHADIFVGALLLGMCIGAIAMLVAILLAASARRAREDAKVATRVGVMIREVQNADLVKWQRSRRRTLADWRVG